MKDRKIAVIGGGIQGLAIAYYLSKNPENSVEIFEKNPRLGGLLGLLKVEGTGIEGFYHHWSNRDSDIIELAEELGLSQNLYRAPSKIGIFYGGKTYDFTTAGDLLRFAPLGMRDRLRVGLTVLGAKFAKDPSRLAGLKASDWLKNKSGAQAYKIIWEPLLRGKFGKEAENISLAWMVARLGWRAKTRRGGKEELVYPRGGFEKLIDAMTGQIKQKGAVRAGTPVDSLSRLAADYDLVFVTSPIHVFLKIAPELPAEYAARLRRIRYRAAKVAMLVLKNPLLRQGHYWLNVNDPGFPFLGVIEHTNLVPKEDYGGKSIVYLSNYLDPEDALFKMGETETLETYYRHLPRINSEFNREWIQESRVFTDLYAQPIVDTEYFRNIPPFKTPLPKTYLVTMAQIFPDDRGTNNAARQAKEVLRELKLL